MGLVVKSAISELIKKTNMRLSSDTYEALDKRIERKLQDAVSRAKENNRKTVMPYDL